MEYGIAEPSQRGAVGLADGRALAWAAWGPPDGTPVLFFGGAAMGRSLGFGADALDRLNVRLISMERPGLGASDPDPTRTLADWPRDVEQLIQAFGLSGVRIVGFSQGAPFALACAADGLPTAVAIASGQDDLRLSAALRLRLPGSPAPGRSGGRVVRSSLREVSMSIWASGSPYERYVGRWSRLVAREFLAWLAAPEGGQWLDVGCGTGALSEAILRQAAPAGLIGCDPSGGFLEHARAEIVDTRVRFEQADARALPFEDHQFDAVVGGLMLNFVPEPERALAEMARVTRPGGTVAVYVWDYAGEMQLMRLFWDAAAALDPSARDLDEGVRFPICQPEPLARLFEGTGLDAVRTRAIDVPTVFRDFDDYWSPFLGAQGPAPSYAASLDEPRRDALRDRIHASVSAADDGSIHLRARAWAVSGAVR